MTPIPVSDPLSLLYTRSLHLASFPLDDEERQKLPPPFHSSLIACKYRNLPDCTILSPDVGAYQWGEHALVGAELERDDRDRTIPVAHVLNAPADTVSFLLHTADLKKLTDPLWSFINIHNPNAYRKFPSVIELLSSPPMPMTFYRSAYTAQIAHIKLLAEHGKCIRRLYNESTINHPASVELTPEQRVEYFNLNPPAWVTDNLFMVPTSIDVERFDFTARAGKHEGGRGVVNFSGVLVPGRLVETMRMMPVGVLGVEPGPLHTDAVPHWRVTLTIHGKKFVLPVSNLYSTTRTVIEVRVQYRYYPGDDLPSFLTVDVDNLLSQNVIRRSVLNKAQGIPARTGEAVLPYTFKSAESFMPLRQAFASRYALMTGMSPTAKQRLYAGSMPNRLREFVRLLFTAGVQSVDEPGMRVMQTIHARLGIASAGAPITRGMIDDKLPGALAKAWQDCELASVRRLSPDVGAYEPEMALLILLMLKQQRVKDLLCEDYRGFMSKFAPRIRNKHEVIDELMLQSAIEAVRVAMSMLSILYVGRSDSERAAARNMLMSIPPYSLYNTSVDRARELVMRRLEEA